MSKSVTITATANKVNGQKLETPVTASFDMSFGETSEESVKMFGDDVVNSGFNAATVVKAQARLRSLLEKGKTPDEAAALMSSYKPGVAAARVGADPKAAYMAMFNSLTPEQKLEELKKLQQSMKGN